MASPSKSSLRSVPDTPQSVFVRRYADSNAVGFHRESSSLPVQGDAPKVISCDFEIKIPTTALRIDMSILVSSDSNECKGNPSIAFKITICTPRQVQQDHIDDNYARCITTTTLRWSSKFAIAKGNENRSPYHQWSGSFDIGDNRHTDLSDCSFHHFEGSFRSNAEKVSDCIVPDAPISSEAPSINKRKSKKNLVESDDMCMPRTAKRRRTGTLAK